MDTMDGVDSKFQKRYISNLYLLFLAVFLSILNNYLSSILNYFQIHLMANAFTNSSHLNGLKLHLVELKKESAQIDMTDEFAKYARLQRKILKVQDEVNKIAQAQMASNTKKRWFLQILLSIVFMVLMYLYKSEPVVKFPPELVYPLSWLLSWPGSDPGSISFLVWCAISNSVVKSFA